MPFNKETKPKKNTMSILQTSFEPVTQTGRRAVVLIWIDKRKLLRFYQYLFTLKEGMILLASNFKIFVFYRLQTAFINRNFFNS